jgi:hypothetical protein
VTGDANEVSVDNAAEGAMKSLERYPSHPAGASRRLCRAGEMIGVAKDRIHHCYLKGMITNE